MLAHAKYATKLMRKGTAPPRPRTTAGPHTLKTIQKRFIADHYAALGVSSTASQAEIKKAFFEKAKKVHPDVNKGDSNAQQKFVELSAAYEVLKNKDKRAAYDAQRQYGGGFGSPFGSAYGQQQQQSYQQSSHSTYGGGGPQQSSTGYNPFRANPYGQGPAGGSPEDFMRWYQSQYGDAFREFDEFNKGQTTIIEERMPDGSYRIRVVRRPGSASRGGAARQRAYERASQDPQDPQVPNMEAMISQIFGRGVLGTLFKSIVRDGFSQSGPHYQDYSQHDTGSGIPFGSGFLDHASAKITELQGQLAFTVNSGHHVGTMSHKALSGDQGDVLTCQSDNKVLAKARRYIKEGSERILIENGNSQRVATIDACSEPDVLKSSNRSFFKNIQTAITQFYKIVDGNEVPLGFASVSPLRRNVLFYDSRGDVVASLERKDIEQANINSPTRDDWDLTINGDPRHFDSSVFIFTAAFSTLIDRRSALPVPGLSSVWRLLSAKLR